MSESPPKIYPINKVGFHKRTFYKPYKYDEIEITNITFLKERPDEFRVTIYLYTKMTNHLSLTVLFIKKSDVMDKENCVQSFTDTDTHLYEDLIMAYIVNNFHLVLDNLSLESCDDLIMSHIVNNINLVVENLSSQSCDEHFK